MAKRLFEILGSTKSCTHCKLFKSFSEFSANKNLACGMQSHCKSCKASLLTERRKNPEYRRLLNEHAKKNRHVARARRRRNRVADMLEQAKARAKRKGIPFELAKSDVHIPVNCPVFGIPFAVGSDGNPVAEGKFSQWSASLDCIVPALGYVRGNVQVISYKANTMKGNATREQLVAFAMWVLSDSAEVFSGKRSQLKAVA